MTTKTRSQMTDEIINAIRKMTPEQVAVLRYNLIRERDEGNLQPEDLETHNQIIELLKERLN